MSWGGCYLQTLGALNGQPSFLEQSVAVQRWDNLSIGIQGYNLNIYINPIVSKILGLSLSLSLSPLNFDQLLTCFARFMVHKPLDLM